MDHHFHLKKIKFIFTVVIIIVIMSMVFGGFAVKRVLLTQFNKKNLVTQKINIPVIQYLSYQDLFGMYENSDLAQYITNNKTFFKKNTIAKSIPVLLYHGILNQSDGYNVTYEYFKQQMFALKMAGWQTISMEEFHRFENGEINLPDKSFLLTFDDGRRDSYVKADPILKVLNYKAVMFVITEHSVDSESINNYYLSKSELVEMNNSGRWDIQAHTKDGHNVIPINSQGDTGHFFSNKLWLAEKNRLETEEEYMERVSNDLVSAKNDLEALLGTHIIAFAFPFGDYGQNTINNPEAKNVISAIINKYYSEIFYQVDVSSPTFNFPLDYFHDNYKRRIEVKKDWDGKTLIENLEDGREKTLPYKEDFLNIQNWRSDWGDYFIENNQIITKSNSDTTGSAIYLNGTGLWNNYSVSTSVNFVKGESFSLIASYKNDENYLSCDYGTSFISLNQKINGNKIKLKEWKSSVIETSKQYKVGIITSAKSTKCLLNGKNVLSTNLVDKTLNLGGIGFKTWAPNNNNAELHIEDVVIHDVNE